MLKEGEPSVVIQRNKQLELLASFAPYGAGLLTAVTVFFVSRQKLGDSGAVTAGLLSALVSGWVFSQFM